jgi:hypothetical protein
MRRFFAAAAIAAALGAASAASATTFTGTYDVTDYHSGSNGGLNIDIQDAAPSGTSLGLGNMNFGDVKVVDLFYIWAGEDVGSDDTGSDPIAVKFNFTSPVGSGTVNGDTWGVTGQFEHGVVHWDGPININFGAAGTMNIALNNATFYEEPDCWRDCNNNYKALIKGTFTLNGPAGGAVPEPASWAMMITGFGLAGATLRRRRTAAAAA